MPTLLLPRASGTRRVAAWASSHDTWACCWTADRVKLYHDPGSEEALLLAATGLLYVALIGENNEMGAPSAASPQRSGSGRPPPPWLLAITGDGVVRVLSASFALQQGQHGQGGASLDRLGGTPPPCLLSLPSPPLRLLARDLRSRTVLFEADRGGMVEVAASVKDGVPTCTSSRIAAPRPLSGGRQGAPLFVPATRDLARVLGFDPAVPWISAVTAGSDIVLRAHGPDTDPSTARALRVAGRNSGGASTPTALCCAGPAAVIAFADGGMLLLTRCSPESVLEARPDAAVALAARCRGPDGAAADGLIALALDPPHGRDGSGGAPALALAPGPDPYVPTVLLWRPSGPVGLDLRPALAPAAWPDLRVLPRPGRLHEACPMACARATAPVHRLRARALRGDEALRAAFPAGPAHTGLVDAGGRLRVVPTPDPGQHEVATSTASGPDAGGESGAAGVTEALQRVHAQARARAAVEDTARASAQAAASLHGLSHAAVSLQRAAAAAERSAAHGWRDAVSAPQLPTAAQRAVPLRVAVAGLCEAWGDGPGNSATAAVVARVDATQRTLLLTVVHPASGRALHRSAPLPALAPGAGVDLRQPIPHVLLPTPGGDALHAAVCLAVDASTAVDDAAALPLWSGLLGAGSFLAPGARGEGQAAHSHEASLCPPLGPRAAAEWTVRALLRRTEGEGHTAGDDSEGTGSLSELEALEGASAARTAARTRTAVHGAAADVAAAEGAACAGRGVSSAGEGGVEASRRFSFSVGGPRAGTRVTAAGMLRLLLLPPSCWHGVRQWAALTGEEEEEGGGAGAAPQAQSLHDGATGLAARCLACWSPAGTGRGRVEEQGPVWEARLACGGRVTVGVAVTEEGGGEATQVNVEGRVRGDDVAAVCCVRAAVYSRLRAMALGCERARGDAGGAGDALEVQSVGVPSDGDGGDKALLAAGAATASRARDAAARCTAGAGEDEPPPETLAAVLRQRLLARQAQAAVLSLAAEVEALSPRPEPAPPSS